MSWNTDELTPESILVMDGNVVVGNILHVEEKWFVEILWSGQSGDITFEASNKGIALAFVKGVESAIEALKDMKP